MTNHPLLKFLFATFQYARCFAEWSGGRYRWRLLYKSRNQICRVSNCLNSLQQHSHKTQNDHLHAWVEISFTILPESSTFLNPRKTSFHHPSLRNNCKGMKFVLLGYLHFRFKQFLHFLSEMLSRIPSVRQYLFYLREIFFVFFHCLENSFSVGNVGGCYGYTMRQSLRIYQNVPFNAWNLLPSVIPFLMRWLGILYALGVYDAQTRSAVLSIS